MQIEPLENIKLSFKCPKQLNELQPCNGDWYCDGCQKIVYDFRGMTEAQILQVISEKQTVCGIFEAGRIEVLPQQNRLLRWASAAMLALGLTTFHKAVMGQNKKVVHTESVTNSVEVTMGIPAIRLTDTTKIEPFIGAVISSRPLQKSNDNALARPLSDGIVFGGMGYDPEYPGGRAALAKYLYDHVKYSGNHQGKAYVQFVIGKDGSISNIKMIRSAGKDIDEQIIKALKNSKKWKPALQNGKPVSVQYAVPFNLECKE